jgi:DNA-binding SARP family transcriptional activator
VQAGWYVDLLGPVALTHDGRPVALPGPTARAVLAALALQRSGASVGDLITGVWGGPGEVSRNSVYHYVKQLRSTVPEAAGDGLIRSVPYGYRLAVDDDAIDWRRFLVLVDRARDARTRSRWDDAAALLGTALQQWRGPPLGGIGSRLEADRRRMTEQRLAAIEELAGVEAVRGNPDRVHDLLTVEVAQAPYRERAAALLIRALTALGRREEASAAFHTARAHLARELGLDPSEDLVSAYRESLDGAVRIQLPYGTRASTAEAAAAMPTAPVPAVTGLPRADRHFTGRHDEINKIIEALAVDRAVCVVSGMAGVGKTSLAVQVADRLASQFPDGTVFIDLAGHSPGRVPLMPIEALDRLLRRLGVTGEHIPPDPDEQAALYRHQLSGRRMLILLDNAADAAQVRPLLPAAVGCATLVTSRRPLSSLDDAEHIELDVLPGREAAALFRAVVGRARLRREPDAEPTIARVVRRCGQLPLAIRIAAARHRGRANRTLADLHADLDDAHATLDELDDGERSVAASLNASFATLPLTLRRAFTLLAVNPGDDVGLAATAALLGEPADVTARVLDGLIDHQLLWQHRRHRYRLHDLVGAFAWQRAQADLSETERANALRRLVDYYQRAADAADRVITPHRFREPLDLIDESARLPELAGYDDAFGWLSDEEPNITELCRTAFAADLHRPCWLLAYTMRGFYFLTKHWQPWLATHAVALAAAQRSGDRRAEAIIHNNLGLAHIEQGHLDLARQHYDTALHLFLEAGDTHGEQTARANRAWISFAQGRYPEFIELCEPVLAFYRDRGASRNAAITLRGIGLALTELGRYERAVRHLTEALEALIALNLRLDVAMTLNALGEAHHRAGDRRSAEATFAEALAASRRCRSGYEWARARHRLGDLADERGDARAARAHWAAALDSYERLGAPQAAEVLARLDRSPSP